MITRKSRLAKALVLALAVYPQLVLSEGFTAADVLAWDAESQEGLFQNSVSMTAMIASQKKDSGQYAGCMESWYGNELKQEELFHEYLTHLARYSEHHPQAVFLAWLQSICGKIFE
ncbi:MAG: hypothetical protein ACPGNV_05140 [Mangrovicoccus sp.]